MYSYSICGTAKCYHDYFVIIYISFDLTSTYMLGNGAGVAGNGLSGIRWLLLYVPWGLLRYVLFVRWMAVLGRIMS